MSSSAPKPTILETIYAQRAKDVDLAKSTPGTTPDDLSALLAMNLAPPLIPLLPRLKRNPSLSTSPSLMAEIKRASPSKGPIALTTNAAQQALTYALSGASVISVLTEPTWFKGSLLDMRLAREAIDALPDRPAILRKEFILDEYQITEARLWGADTVLLIVAMLSPEKLRSLYAYSCSLGMEPLVEVNNAKEMQLALELGAKVIGVNNRNLHDFEVDMGTTSRLAELVKGQNGQVVLCALSGISSKEDVRIYKDQGVGAVLVGEALMRAKDTGKFIREMLEWPENVAAENKTGATKPWVKVSGVRTVEEAVKLTEAGADMLGYILDENQPQSISLNEASKIATKIRASRVAPPPSPTPSPVQKPWFTSQKDALVSTSPRPLLVGIFNFQPSLSYIQHVVAIAQLDLVQLDSTYESDIDTAGWIKHIPVPVIRRFTVNHMENFTRPGMHSFALLDFGKSLKVTEGDLKTEEVKGWKMPFILRAGGSVLCKSLIAELEPWAVDIDVDGEKGAMDLIKDFIGL